MNRAVFLDRDGVLIHDRADYVKSTAEVAIIPGAIYAVSLLASFGFRLVLWSNQGGVAQLVGHETASRVMDHVASLFDVVAGVQLELGYNCFHPASERCACRKPLPSLLWKAAAYLHLDLSRSYVIEDWPANLTAADAVGARGVFVTSGRGIIPEKCRWPVCADVLAASQWIVQKGQNA